MNRNNERGVTMLVVMVLLSVMLLGGLAFARMSEVGALAVGNANYREAALQASEIGLNAAFAQVRATPVVDEELGVAGSYWAIDQPKDADGLPVIDWDAAPEIAVGAYSVRFATERVCTVAVVTSPLQECLVKQVMVPTSADPTREKIDPPNSKQYRVTVRVTGPKGTTTFVQSLITKG
jgi:type IV pilus assembly protein PilX